MKRTLVLTSAALLFATPAFAGSTANRWTNGHESGTSRVKVDNVRVESGQFTRETLNVKIDATTDEGGTATVTGQFNSDGITGNAFATTNQVDPYIMYSSTSNLETGEFTDVTAVDAFTKTDFGSTYYEHRLDSNW